MLLLGILWVLLLLGLCHWWVPGQGYPTALELRMAYHALWLVMTGLLICIHYHLMTGAGHRMLAIVLDIGTLGIASLLWWLRKSSAKENR